MEQKHKIEFAELQETFASTIATTKKTEAETKTEVGEEGRKVELHPKKVELLGVDLDIAKAEAAQAEIETDLAQTAYDNGIALDLLKAPLVQLELAKDRLEFDNIQEYNKILLALEGLSDKDFGQLLELEGLKLEAIKAENKTVIDQYRIAARAVAAQGGGEMPRSISSLLNLHLQISANYLTSYIEYKEAGEEEAANKILQVMNESINQANNILMANGFQSYMLPNVTGVDRQGNLQFLQPSPQGGLAPRQQAPGQLGQQAPGTQSGLNLRSYNVDDLVNMRMQFDSDFGITTTPKSGFYMLTPKEKKTR